MVERVMRPGDVVARRAALECLARAGTPLPPLEVARAAHLSTLVVVPVLGALVEEGLVTRDQRARGPAGQVAWTYRLTARGSRAVAAGARRAV